MLPLRHLPQRSSTTPVSRTVYLTRISHQPSAATPNMPVSAALRSLGLLNIPSGMPTSSSLRAPCIHRHLQRFATMPGEKSGLRLSPVFSIDIWRELRAAFQEVLASAVSASDSNSEAVSGSSGMMTSSILIHPSYLVPS